MLDGAMARNDPTDTGGLFIGRRPGTRPLKYRAAPVRDPRRMRLDSALANLVLLVEVALCLSLWGPQPVGWLWVGSQVDYLTGSVMLGIVVAFLGLLGSLMITLSVTTRLDGLWRILRRAGGHEQRDGILGRIFAVSAVTAGAAFAFWFIVIQGPGPALAPRQ
jgi:hypothetical protein